MKMKDNELIIHWSKLYLNAGLIKEQFYQGICDD